MNKLNLNITAVENEKYIDMKTKTLKKILLFFIILFTIASCKAGNQSLKNRSGTYVYEIIDNKILDLSTGTYTYEIIDNKILKL